VYPETVASQVICAVPGGGEDGAEGTAQIGLDQILNRHSAELELLTKTNYAVCDTAGNVAAKTVDISPFVLNKGDEVTVKFIHPNTAPAASLNVSGSGAKPIMYKGQPLPGRLLSGVQKFSYDGENWDLLGDPDTNTDTTYDIISVAEALEGTEILPRTVSAANLNQIVTAISTDIVNAELSGMYDIGGLQASLNDLIFRLAANGVIDGDGLDTVITIDSESDIVLISGMYADGKVYI
jgi:hypothetical protein